MKLKSVLLLALSTFAGLSAQAQVIAAKQIINISGVVHVTSPNGKTTIPDRGNTKDFIYIIADDMGYPFTNAELRSAKLVTFDFGFGLEGLYIEFRNSETREINYLDVSDRFFFDYVSDVSGNQDDLHGKWKAVFEIGIDLIDDESEQAEFWGLGLFSGNVRLMRRGGANIQVPTAGLNARNFPAVLDITDDEFEDAVPGTLTVNFRTTAVVVDDLIIIGGDE